MQSQIFLRHLFLIAMVLFPAISVAQSQTTCAAYLATDRSPASLATLAAPGSSQRATLLADTTSKLVALGSRYYSVTIPAAFYTASRPVVVFELSGTGGYPEAAWTDWHTTMSERGYAFISLAWGGGSMNPDSDTQLYANLTKIAADVATVCPIANARKWLMGFSVGSAVSFAVMIRDTLGQKLFTGQLGLSGAAIGPLTTGRDLMHSTVEANRINPTAVLGIRTWLYCGELDFDHIWGMCTEMPNGEAFVKEHGGTATLYKDPTGTHNSLPANVAGRNQMFDFIAANSSAANYTDLWWNAAESGWGMSVAQHGNTQFNVLYIYDSAGKPQWVVMPGGTWNADFSVFTGDIYIPTGSPYFNFNPALSVVGTKVGSANITYANNNTATLRYTINGVSGQKSIQRFAFGAADNTLGLKVDDLWWNASENGWGLNITQQNRTLFAVWYTYDSAGKAIWFVVPGGVWSGNIYTADMYTTTSSAWIGSNFNPAQNTSTKVGTMTLSFTDASRANFSYTVNGITQTKSITRLVY